MSRSIGADVTLPLIWASPPNNGAAGALDKGLCAVKKKKLAALKVGLWSRVNAC